MCLRHVLDSPLLHRNLTNHTGEEHSDPWLTMKAKYKESRVTMTGQLHITRLIAPTDNLVIFMLLSNEKEKAWY